MYTPLFYSIVCHVFICILCFEMLKDNMHWISSVENNLKNNYFTEKPKLDMSSVKDITVKLGQNYAIRVPYKAWPKPSALWTINEEELPSVARIDAKVFYNFVQVLTRESQFMIFCDCCLTSSEQFSNHIMARTWWDDFLCFVLDQYPYLDFNSLRIDMSFHSNTICRLRANQYLLWLLNDVCLAEKQQIPIL